MNNFDLELKHIQLQNEKLARGLGEIYTILFNTVNVVYYRITLMMYNDIMQIAKRGGRFKRNGRNENA